MLSTIEIGSSSQYQCTDPTNGADQSRTLADPGILIGLALSFAKQGPEFSGQMPELILENLANHVRLGDPACRLVLGWLNRRRQRSASTPIPTPGAEMISASTHGEVRHG